MIGACAWKSDKDLVPEDQIECLLSLLLEAEKRRWQASISPVNSLGRDDTQSEENGRTNCSSLDAGFHLLGYGQCVNQIHSYFHCFEPNHYCLKATTHNKNPERPSSQMKVVSNDESLTYSTSRTTSRDSVHVVTHETSGVFNHKHPLFELCKNALLCAKFPVLNLAGTASPSTPYSPNLSPSVQKKEFIFSKVPSTSAVSPDPKLSPMPTSTKECISPEVSFPNLSDALQELVMNVFSLKKKVCEYVFQRVPQAKEPRKLLVETLLSQRAVLEHNKHPFYSVQAFMDKNAYSEWVMLEKEKTEHLVRSFWHKACPPVRELPLEDQGFHKQYVDLMKRIIRYESKNKELHPVHGGVTPSSPLSTHARCLLKEFQLRFGIGSLFCKISYLDYLVNYLENEVWYMQHVGCCLQDVMDHVTCPEIFVESEFKMLVSLLSSLLCKMKYALTRVRKIFPANCPKEGIPALVSLFKLSVESSRYLQSEFVLMFAKLYQAQVFPSNWTTKPLCDVLASFLKDEMNSRYERLKVIAVDELNQDSLSPRLVIKLILEIRNEVKEYDTFYRVAFSSYFDVKELAAIGFYSLLMSDVEELCENPPRARRPDNVEPNMLCLAFRLSKLDKDWSMFIPFSRQIWRQPFQEFAQQWLDAISRSFRTLVPQMTDRDTWKAAEVNFAVSQKKGYHATNERRPTQRPFDARSASLQSLMHSQHSAFDTVRPSSSVPAKTLKSGRKSIGKHQSSHTSICSCPVLRPKCPKRPRPGRSPDSSSDEETSNQGIPSHIKEVVVQIHQPKAKGGIDTKGGVDAKTERQANAEDEISNEVVTAAHVIEIEKDDLRVETEAKTSSGVLKLLPTSTQVDNFQTMDNQGSAKLSFSEPSKDQMLEDKSNVSKIGYTTVNFKRVGVGESQYSEKHRETYRADGNGRNKAEQSDLANPRSSSAEVGSDTDVKSKGDRASTPFTMHCVSHLSDNESRTEGAQMSLENEDLSNCVSDHVSVKAPCKKENAHENLIEESFIANDHERSRGVVTPFENESSDESNSETLIHSSALSIELASDQQESQEGHHERKTEQSSSLPGLNSSSYADVKTPVEDRAVDRKEKGSGNSHVRCQAKDVRAGNNEEKEHKKVVLGSSDVIAIGQKPSSPINMPPSWPNKLTARLRDTCGSVGSALSIDSFVTASESVDSFNSACSQVVSSQVSCSKGKESKVDHSETLRASQEDPSTSASRSDDEMDKTQSGDNPLQVLPISSSFVDVLCAISRLASFVSHLCEILCPNGALQNDENGDDGLRVESLRTKRQLYNKLFQVVHSFVKLYLDSVLAIETCGLQDEVLAEIVDGRLLRHLTLEREAGNISYHTVGQFWNTMDTIGRIVPPCNEMSTTKGNHGQCEPLSHQMGVRISNVTILRNKLAWLCEYVVAPVNNPPSLLSASSNESLFSLSLSYCECGPSLDGVTNHKPAEATRRDATRSMVEELLSRRMLTDDLDHFCRLETAQFMLVAFKISKSFNQVLSYLLNLDLPRYTIRKRLKPAMDFLTCECRRFNSVLYPDCFNKLLTEIWVSVAKTFKEECSCLVRKGSLASEHSKVLLQAVAYLMEFFHAEGIGLGCDKMAAALGSTVKDTQLYTSPTKNLITMYNSLNKQVSKIQSHNRTDERSSSISGSSHHASANAPADFIFQALREDLHSIRKCFTGAQLVEWVENYVRKNDLKDFGVCVGTTDTETGIELGQYMLDHGLIICLAPPPLLRQQAPKERRNQDETVFIDNAKGEKGKVYINSITPPDIRIDDISVITHGSQSSSSRSTSRCSTEGDLDSQHDADDEYEDDDDFLGSRSDMWARSNSVLAVRNATFFNDHNAFYKFIGEEDSSRTEIKIRLGIRDLLGELNKILCVLYTRKGSDRSARIFVERVPREQLNEAIDGAGEAMCYGVFRICETS